MAGDVDRYLAGLADGADRTEMQRLHQVIVRHVPGVGQATSYGMPCYTYRGVPVAAVIARRKHIAWYPYSGSVLSELGDDLAGYSQSRGALRFTAETPLPDRVVRRLLDVRMQQLDTL